MNTREQIVEIAGNLILSKGFNAFSFGDIANRLNIKKASIHYHFANKEALGVELINLNIDNIKQLINETANRTAIEQFKAYQSIYHQHCLEGKVCIIGSLSTDLLTIGDQMREKLKELAGIILEWLIDILQKGKKEGKFQYENSDRVRALMIGTNMLASLQIARVTSVNDFELIKENVLKEILI